MSYSRYTVTLCPDCECVFIYKDDPDTATCQRCNTQYRVERLRALYTADTSDEAIQARTEVRARVNDMGEEYEQAQEHGLLTAGSNELIHEDTESDHLKANGVSAEAIDTQVNQKLDNSGSRSQKKIVTDAIAEQTQPTRDDVVEYATECGVSRETVTEILTKLRHDGAVIETGDGRLRTV